MNQSSEQFSQIVLIESHDADPFYNLKLANLFVYFQDVVTQHMENLGINKSIIQDRGLYWVVNRYKVHIERMPKYLDKVKVLTYPGKDMRFIFPRYFEIIDDKGTSIIKASSTWLVLNQSNKEINMNPFDGKLLPHFSKDGELPLPKKIEIVEAKEVEKRTVKLSELDLNNHLNNTKYIEFICDVLGYEFFEKNVITDFEINYLRQIAYNKEVSLCMHKDKSYVIIEGKVDNELAFLAKIDYQEK